MSKVTMWNAIEWAATDVAKKKPGTRYWKGSIYALWDMVRKEVPYVEEGWALRYNAFRPHIIQPGPESYMPNATIILIQNARDDLSAIDQLILVDASAPPSAQFAYEHLATRRAANTCQFCGHVEITELGRSTLEPIPHSSTKIHKLCKWPSLSWYHAARDYEKTMAVAIPEAG
jgi:hypothetical protein